MTMATASAEKTLMPMSDALAYSGLSGTNRIRCDHPGGGD
jgi:hypothetical protein